MCELKARPPILFRDVTVNYPDNLVATVRYASGNGAPTGACLVPVMKAGNGRWKRAPGFQLNCCDVRVGNGHMARTVGLSWPAGVKRALLFLFHCQIEKAGDPAFALPPEVRTHGSSREALIAAAFTSLPQGDLGRGVLDAAVLGIPPEEAAVPHQISFALASCQYPAGIFDGGVRTDDRDLDERHLGPAELSLWGLAARCETDPSIRFSVFCGDQVYVDATAGLFDSRFLLDGLATAYQLRDANKGWQRLGRLARNRYCVIDDHEIVDNWEPMPAGGKRDDVDDRLVPGVVRYVGEQRVPQWPTHFVMPYVRFKALYDARNVCGLDFFFTDTRTERDGRTVFNYDCSRIMSTGQEQCLDGWLEAMAAKRAGGTRKNALPAFIASPSILLPRRLATAREAEMALYSDAWDGYPSSLYAVLAKLFQYRAQRVIFLSGDEHLSCVARITLTRDGSNEEIVAHSVHSSALYAPYPFANSVEADFPADDRFDFTHDGYTYQCRVETEFPRPGDGFAVLSVRGDQTCRQVFVDFDRCVGQREIFELCCCGPMSRSSASAS
jgi:hypothetical protein